MTADLEQIDGLAERCLSALRARNATLATAESLTAGLVAATIADIPGASDVLRGGLVAYASEIKTSVLGVDASLVERYGVVSRECAEAMALRACRVFGAVYAVSTTGVAGPDRQEGKPVGTVFVAVADGSSGIEAVRVGEMALTGSRADIRRATVAATLHLLADVLTEVEERSRRAREHQQ